jgi:hypothetical protein
MMEDGIKEGIRSGVRRIEPTMAHDPAGVVDRAGLLGLTKREYFAACAMQGAIANPEDGKFGKEAAENCVRIADALIAALNEVKK